jgi:hypothetical protein
MRSCIPPRLDARFRRGFAACKRSRTISDFEIFRLRDSSSISATRRSGKRTVRVFISLMYYTCAMCARRRPIVPVPRRLARAVRVLKAFRREKCEAPMRSPLCCCISPGGRGRGSIAISHCCPVTAQSFPFVLSIPTVQQRKMLCDSQGLLGQCALATVAILGSLATWNP